MQRFTGKSVLVTGGSSGIGLAAAQAYAAEGARVVLTGRDASSLERARALIGGNTVAIDNDVSDASSARSLAQALETADVRLDAVFINAGVAQFVAFTDVDQQMWDRIFDTNVKGAYFGIQALLPVLNRGAAIVLNGSINAHLGMPNTSVYAASKAALISLAKTLSAELLPRAIRVNVVSPGPVATPIYNKLGLDPSAVDGVAAQIQSQIPLGRFGTPQEIAATVLHLSAAESAYIIGSEIIVDGGMSQL